MYNFFDFSFVFQYFFFFYILKITRYGLLITDSFPSQLFLFGLERVPVTL